MAAWVVIVLFFNLMLSGLAFGFRRNMLLFFNAWWFFWIFLSTLNFLNFYPVAPLTYFMIAMGVLSINVAYSSAAFLKLHKLGELKEGAWRFNGFVEITYTLVLILLLIRMYNLIGGFDNYNKVRFYFFGLELEGETISLFTSPIQGHVFYFLKAFSFLNFIISLSLFFFRGKAFLFVLSVANVFLFSLLSAGRDVLPYLIVITIFSLRMNMVKRVKFYILSFVTIVLLVTFLREGGLEKVFYGLVSYFTGSIVYLDILLGHEAPLYNGKILLSSIFAPVAFVFQENPFTAVGEELMDFVRVSEQSPFFDFYNALPTWFYFFYRDFGYAGFILVPMVIGVFLSVLERKLNFRKPEHVSLVSFVEFTLLWSIFKMEVFGFYNVLIICLYLFLLRGKNSVSCIGNRI